MSCINNKKAYDMIVQTWMIQSEIQNIRENRKFYLSYHGKLGGRIESWRTNLTVVKILKGIF